MGSARSRASSRTNAPPGSLQACLHCRLHNRRLLHPCRGSTAWAGVCHSHTLTYDRSSSLYCHARRRLRRMYAGKLTHFPLSTPLTIFLNFFCFALCVGHQAPGRSECHYAATRTARRQHRGCLGTRTVTSAMTAARSWFRH